MNGRRCAGSHVERAVNRNAGHFTRLDAPDRFWPTIVEFIHRYGPGRRVNAVAKRSGEIAAHAGRCIYFRRQPQIMGLVDCSVVRA